MGVLSILYCFSSLVTLSYGEAGALVPRPGHGMKKKMLRKMWIIAKCVHFANVIAGYG